MATAMIRAGHFTQSDWASALGAELKRAKDNNAPDTEATYFQAALTALEALSTGAGISPGDRLERKAEWEQAYRQTPHGKPVRIESKTT